MSTRVHFHLPFPSAYKYPPSSSSLSNFVLVLSVIRMRGCSLVTRSSTPRTFVLGFHNLLRSPPPSSSCKYSSVFRNSPPSSLTSTSSCAVGRRKPFLGSFRFVLGMSSGSSSAKEPQSIHDFTVKDVKGNDVSLSDYKGKVLLVVNVASECGLTNSNYKELNELYGKYKEKGLEILAFPSNQFGGQEPGSNEQIVERACSRFKAEFPVFGKVDVNGDNADPVYKYLKNSKSSLLGNGIKWNFAKFLVDQEGRVVDRYMPTTSPMSIEKDIKKLLGVVSS